MIRGAAATGPWMLLLALLAAPAAGQGGGQQPPASGLVIGGDVATRAELIRNEFFAETDETRRDDTRFRTRLRLRLGGRAQLSDHVEAQLRLTTGSPSYPTSAWTTPADVRRHTVQIDRAFLAAALAPGVRVQLGAGPNPLFTPTELVWDADVQPAGLATSVQRAGLALAAGQYVLREARTSQPANEQAAYLFAHGLSYTRSGGAATVTLGAAQYRFVNADVLARSVQLGELDADFRTNRFDPRGRTAPDPRQPGRTLPVDYLSEYDVVNLGLRAALRAVPLALAADVAVNRGARRDAALGPGYATRQNLGYGAMLRYGAAIAPGGWAVGAGLFRIEADAVLAPLNSDDLQQTNVFSVPLDAQLVLRGGVRLTWDTYLQRKLEPALASSGGVVHDENALKVRTRLTASASF